MVDSQWRAVGAQFEAQLLAQVLQPMGRAFGPAGSLALDNLCARIADQDAHGFGRLLASMLEKRYER